jgi:hypothetical protein
VQQDSGQLRLDGDVIRYRSATFGDWDLALVDVRLIGEATNEDGPGVDDYWFCFATGLDRWREASFYSEDRAEFFTQLSARLNIPIELGLCSSATFRSRILWPPELLGKPMFVYTDVPVPWYRRWFTFPRKRQTFSEEARRVLERG